MARRAKAPTGKTVEALRHGEATRKDISTAEYQSVVQKEAQDPVLSVGTMHLSKGLEFRAVAVMARDDEVLPLQARIEAVTDEGDLREVYETNVTCCTWRAPGPVITCW